MSGSFFESVYEAVKQIPEGKVASYGQIALAVGSPKASRQVGWALHCNPYQGIVPCHRVVFRDGSLTQGFAFGGREVQKSLLENEGVIFKDECTVDMEKCRWRQ